MKRMRGRISVWRLVWERCCRLLGRGRGISCGRQEQWLAFVQDTFAHEAQPTDRAMLILELDRLIFQIDVDAGQFGLIQVWLALHKYVFTS